MRLNAKIRRKFNRKLSDLPTYHETVGLALASVLAVLEPAGLSFAPVFVPKTGRVTLPLLEGDDESEREIENSVLVIQTHEMTRSGRIELTTYLS